MGVREIIEKSFWKGYATSEISIKTMFICALFTAIIAIYICLIYKLINKKTFYDREFQLSLFGLAIITAMVILTIQSNIVVSLGMVGALSIVRFRTAIKSPMDLVFLFWSISVGIICGAGFAMISVIGSIVLTIGILIFSFVPGDREKMLLVVNCTGNIENSIIESIDSMCTWRVRARNYSKDNINLAIEVKTTIPEKIVQKVSELENVYSVSLVVHDGDVTV